MSVNSSQNPGVLAVRTSSSSRSAARPTSSASSRRAVSSDGSPSTSQVPAGISSSHRSTAGRYWRTRTTVDRVGDGHDGHRARVADDVPLEGLAVRVEEGGRAAAG